MGAAIEDQQVSCLWQGDYLLSVSVSGHINYLDRNNPGVPHRILKVGSQGWGVGPPRGGALVLPGVGRWSSQGWGVTCPPRGGVSRGLPGVGCHVPSSLSSV